MKFERLINPRSIAGPRTIAMGLRGATNLILDAKQSRLALNKRLKTADISLRLVAKCRQLPPLKKLNGLWNLPAKLDRIGLDHIIGIGGTLQ
jgi:hypothetical protein